MNAAEIEAEIGRLVVRMAEWMATHGSVEHGLVLLVSEIADGNFLGTAILEAAMTFPDDMSCVYHSGTQNSPGAAIREALAALVAEIELNEKKEKAEK